MSERIIAVRNMNRGEWRRIPSPEGVVRYKHFHFHFHFVMGTILGEVLLGDCEHILSLNHLVATILLISYFTNKKPDFRDVSKACVARPLVQSGRD